MLTLQVLQGPDRGKRFAVPENEPQLIGRSSEALPITDTTVSRRHAELTPDDGRWYLRDLASSNGTFVNGRRLTERVALAPGDQIRCGATLMLFMPQAGQPRSDVVELLPASVLDVTVEHAADGPASDPLRAARERLRVVYDLTALTASVFDREQLLERVMDLVFEEFKPDRGFILLQESVEDRPEPAVIRYRQRPRTVDEGRIPVSRTIITHTLQRREGILSTNAMNDDRFRGGDSVRDYGIRSAICVPILSGSRVFGVIHIDSSMVDFSYTQEQLRLMNAVGQHTGLALLNLDRLQALVQSERLAAVGQTVASLSHSIKNILQGLRGGADAVALALGRGDLALAREGWPILSRNLDRIFSLTLNMLTFSRPPQLDIELAAMEPVVREATELLRPQFDQKRVALLVDLDEAMPPVPLDTAAMHQALMNLLTNALEAAPPRRGSVTVRTRYLPEAHEAHLQVTDNGSGVAPEARARIFAPFASTKGQRGTGLGLAVTRKIAEEHGGRIEVDSPPGAGATFTIALPSDRLVVDAAETTAPRPLPRHESEPTAWEGEPARDHDPA